MKIFTFLDSIMKMSTFLSDFRIVIPNG